MFLQASNFMLLVFLFFVSKIFFISHLKHSVKSLNGKLGGTKRQAKDSKSNLSPQNAPEKVARYISTSVQLIKSLPQF